MQQVMASLPIIEFAPFRSPSSTSNEREAVARGLDNACRTSGFFYLRGHGVPRHLINSVRDRAIDFFQTASDDDKQSLAIKPSDKARGYSKSTDPSRGAYEALDFYRPVDDTDGLCATGQGANQWPSHPADLRPTAEAYIAHMEMLGRSVTEALALALGIDISLLATRMDKAFWQLRMICYPGQHGGTPVKAGIGEHTDFGILTFLLTDATTHALQVRSKTGEWIYADPVEVRKPKMEVLKHALVLMASQGALLVNIGDMLSEWTRGAYKSTAHRVIHTLPNARVSIPCFFDPNWDALIEPTLPTAAGEAEDGYLGMRYRDRYIRAVEQPLGEVGALPT
ncbi:hypothetical protein LTR53_013183 [Teratosphaeriaceae sp. CCFEE 6253]|nr:hypothetical protein LTR53_013183 [Teratosphaeriaceae sp. CCFEE 6253]